MKLAVTLDNLGKIEGNLVEIIDSRVLIVEQYILEFCHYEIQSYCLKNA